MTLKLLTTITLLLYFYKSGAVQYFTDGSDCKRECKWPAEPAICRFNFTLELYYSMSKACYDCPFNITNCDLQDCVPLNGVARAIMTVNRQFPGPKIEVCEGDSIEVEVTNLLGNSEGTTIHWHGVHVRNSPYMDGVPMITQCAIPTHTKFVYSLLVEPTGTHWWHAHSGMQRSDGLFGALIVRQAPLRNPNSYLYDYDLSEHIMIVHDWLDQLTLAKFASHHHDDGSNKPEAVLINGKGKRHEFIDENGQTQFTPREVFEVEQGFRYMFRSISNAITNCALKISVDNHTLLIISSDGAAINPIEVDAYVIYGGERFGFVLNANQSISNYWVRVKGLADCRYVQELAIIRYKGAASEIPKENEDIDRQGKVLNPLNKEESEDNIPIVELTSTDEEDDPALLQQEPDKKFYLAMDFNKVNNYNYHKPEHYPIEQVDRSHHLYSPQFNHISFEFPSSPLLSQPSDNLEEELCTEETFSNSKNCSVEYCQCTYTLTVRLGDVVELIIVDEGVTFDASHPVHLHGQYFRVIGQGKLGSSTSVEEVKQLDKNGILTRTFYQPVKKDTVIVPDGGYTILRFHATNPGWWLFHCHLEFHIEIGMGLVIHVGDDSDLPEIPDNFPRCGSWPQSVSVLKPTEETRCPPTSTGCSVFSNISFYSYCLIVLSCFRYYK
ncbi:uncharacterized protein [Antedon mediterranea]|uniref:uncharacterized protein n=1 Tax=Antedon mediterranea TaxID=105859 RepID=UPI003AF90B16